MCEDLRFLYQNVLQGLWMGSGGRVSKILEPALAGKRCSSKEKLPSAQWHLWLPGRIESESNNGHSALDWHARLETGREPSLTGTSFLPG